MIDIQAWIFIFHAALIIISMDLSWLIVPAESCCIAIFSLAGCSRTSTKAM
jgi:hypothetical protein